MNKLIARIALRWFRANLGKKNFFSWFQQLQNIASEGMVYGNDKLIANAEANLISRLGSSGNDNWVVFDVGANVGEYSALWLLNNAEVHAFEPGSDAFAELKASYGGRVVANNIALSNQTEVKNLYSVSGENKLSSLIHRSHPKHTWEKGEKVHCVTLDEYCETHKVSAIDFLKIDVEGYEMEVLKGAEQMLPNVKRIQFEFGGAHIEQGLFFRDFYNLLTPNFDLYHILLDGIEKVGSYDEKLENFKGTNFLAVNKNMS